MRKRILSLLLILSMALTFLPTIASAESLETTGEPTLTALTVQNSDGERVSLLNNNDSVTVSLGTTYIFEATFSNVEQISKVYITSTKGNEKKFLETSYDKESGTFVSSGLFDGDSSYVPGKIGVEYTRNINDVKIGDSVDWSTLQATLADYCTATVNSASGEAVQATVDISKLLNAGKDVAINVAIDVFDAATDGDLNEWLGYYHDLESMQKRVLEGGKYYLYLDDTDPETYITMVIRDVSGSKYTKLILNEAGEYFDIWTNVAENLDTVINPISRIVHDCLVIQKSADSLREEIAADPTISSSQKLQLNAEVDAYENDRAFFVLLTSVLPAVVAATGGTMIGPAIVFNAILGMLNAAAGTFWDYRIGMISGGETVDVSFFDGTGSHGVPLTKNFSDITQSGTYYLSEHVITVGIGTDNGEPLDVTLCLHGQSVLGGIGISNGTTLHLCDCTYSENPDGTITGGNVQRISISSGGKLILSNGIIGNGVNKKPISINSGEIIVAGGTIRGDVNSTGSSKITIESGTIVGSIYAEENNETVIYGGHIGASININGGDLEIHGGQIGARIWSINGNVIIDGGLIGQGNASAISNVRNESSILKISGGTITGRVTNDAEGTVYISGGEIICTRADGDKAAGEYSAITNNGGNVTISGGLIKGVGKGGRTQGTSCVENCDGGNVTISGGTFESIDGICIKNSSESSKISITDGTFSSADTVISNSQGEVSIVGGKFQSEEDNCVTNKWGTLTISAGYFQGYYGISEYQGKSSTILMTSDSIIEIEAAKAAFYSYSDTKVILKAKDDYSGGVAVYHSEDAIAINMTIAEAAKIDFSMPYVRLVADNTSGGSDSDDRTTYIVSFNANGGDGAIEPVIVTEGVPFTLPACGFTAPEGTEFKSWSIDGEEYVPGNMYTFTGDTTVTAVWQDVEEMPPITDTCTVTLDPNGGTVKTDALTTDTDGKLSSLPTPTRSGYTFSGWYTAPSSGVQVTTNTVFDQDTTVYAHWTLVSGGSTGGDTTPSAPTYAVAAPSNMKNGTVNINRKNASKGTSVTITVTPDDGYELDELTVNDKNGNALKLTDKGDGRYTFTMPASKVTISAFFAAIAQENEPKPAEWSNPYTDVPEGVWYYDAVKYVTEHGLMGGAGSSDTFQPTMTTTRGMIMTILARMNGVNTEGGAAWYEKGMEWAASTGVSDGSDPERDITRQELITMLWRYAGEPASSQSLSGYPDAAETAFWAADAMRWAVEKGIITHTGEGLLNPTGPATRMEVAAILMRFCQDIAK